MRLPMILAAFAAFASTACEEDIDDPLETPWSLTIPLEPIDRVELLPIAEALIVAGERFVTNQSLPLAIGDGYPDRIEVAFLPLYTIECSLLDATLVIDELTIEGDSVAVSGGATPTAITVEALDEGDAVVVVRGRYVLATDATCTPTEGATEVDVELRLAVAVREPVGVELTPPFACSTAERYLIESGARLADDAGLARGIAIELLDGDGATFRPVNASQRRPAPIVLTGARDTVFTLDVEDGGLEDVVISGPNEIIRIGSSLDDRTALELDMIGARDIDAMDIAFLLLGVGGGSLDLEDGASYGENGWARTSNSIAPSVTALYHEGVPLCTVPTPSAFHLSTTTESTCPVDNDIADPHGDGAQGDVPSPVESRWRSRWGSLRGLRSRRKRDGRISESRGCTAVVAAEYSAHRANVRPSDSVVRIPDRDVRQPDREIATVAESRHAPAFARDTVPAAEVS